MNEVLLHCEKVKKDYYISSKVLEVLKGVTLELRRGELTFILGSSGSGKSTLIHILGGLDRPTEGKVYIENNALDSFSNKKLAAFRNKKVGFVFQFYHLIPELTVWENIIIPGLIARRKLFKKADELLAIVGLSDRKKHLPHQLSGGELQRVALARAFINDPDIVFCDEPTGNLDEGNSAIIYNLIESLNKSRKQTFCIVTHEESLVKDRENVYRLRDGILTKQ